MASSSAFSSVTRPPTLALTRTLSNTSAVLISSGSERSPSPIYPVSRKENRPDSQRSKLMSSPSFMRRERERLTYSSGRRGSYDIHDACEMKYLKLKRKYKQLAEKYEAKCDEHTNLLKAVGNRLSTQPTNTSGSSTSPTATTVHISEPDIPEKYAGLDHSNATIRFPDVKFWTRESFEKSQEKKPSSRRKGADVMEVSSAVAPSRRTGNNKGDPIPYAEYDDGSIMDEATSGAVRALLRQIFNGMGDRLPQKWGDISLDGSKYVYSQLYAHYPCFYLCHDNWKANHLVSRGLTLFHSGQKKKERKLGKTQQGIKVEPKIEGLDTQPLGTNKVLIDSGKKRKAASGGDDNVEPPSKRLHPQPPPPFSSPPPSGQSLPPPLSLVPSPYIPAPPLSAPSPSIPVPAPPSSEPSPSIPAPTPAPPSSVPLPAPFLAPLSGAQPLSPLPPPAAPVVFATPLQPEPAASSPLPPSSNPTATNIINQDHAHTTLLCDSNNQDPAPTASPHNGDNTTATSGSLNQSTPTPPSAHSPGGEPKKIAVTNPLTSKFGAPKAPTKRLEALQKTHEAQQLRQNDGDGSKGKTTDVPNPAGGGSASSSNSGLKKVTKSVAAKNLCYIAYLETNDPITPAAFEKYWKGLPKDVVKRWNDLSKSRKAAGAAEDNEGEEN